MDTLQFLPENKSFSFSDREYTLKSKQKAPLSFYSTSTQGQAKIINCSWLLTLDEYLDFFNFYKEKVEAVETFLISLIIDFAYLETYKAKFIENSFSITEQKGDTVSISINLEAVKV